MAAQKDIPSDCKIRAVIKFLKVEKTSGVEIHRRLGTVYGVDEVMSKQYVCERKPHFDEGWMKTYDEPQCSHPSDGGNNETVACVCALINADRRFTVFKLFSKCHENVSKPA